MKYMGSKRRIAKHILPIILKNRKPRQWYVEPFVGGANMIDKVEGKRIGSDSNEYIIALLQKMSKPSYESPAIDEATYNKIKVNVYGYPKWIVGYVATQLSYGAKWFGGYRRDKQGIRNYCAEAQNNVNKQSQNVQNVDFLFCSYIDLKIPFNSIIYCDPPYEGTTKYKDDFNHVEFWDWCREKVKEGHKVFVSEYNAPNDFICVWQKEIPSSLTKDTGNKKGIEKLFIHKSQHKQ